MDGQTEMYIQNYNTLLKVVKPPKMMGLLTRWPNKQFTITQNQIEVANNFNTKYKIISKPMYELISISYMVPGRNQI